MSAEQNTGVRRTVRQLALALVACMAVAGGAALAAADDSGAVPAEQHAGVSNEWPYSSPTPVAPTN
ncbi:hypothetical protein ACFU3J_00285 [Streptomyces sp. NPDC057411]|uniref:hypothetical protein n=1 Tax=unclassified Streptomyces TaxID=2593676 RepID=UPI003636C685